MGKKKKMKRGSKKKRSGKVICFPRPQDLFLKGSGGEEIGGGGKLKGKRTKASVVQGLFKRSMGGGPSEIQRERLFWASKTLRKKKGRRGRLEEWRGGAE